MVLPGVTIGEGAVIGAQSLVKKDCEPWTVYTGIPVKPLKKRPSDKILELEIKLRSEMYDQDGNYIMKSTRVK